MDHEDLTPEEVAWLLKIGSGGLDEWGATPTINKLVRKGYLRWEGQTLQLMEQGEAVVEKYVEDD